MKGKQRRWMAVFLSSVMTAVLMVQGVAPMQVNAAVSVNLQAQRPETGLELVTVGGQSMADEASMDNTITVVMEGNVGGRTSVARDFELTPTGEVLDISYDEDKEGDKHPPVASYPYCNSAIKPLVHVYDGEVLLHEKADYTISYKNNKNPYSFSRDKAPDNKTPVVIIKMKGNYSGEVRMYFGIEPLSLEGEGAYASPMGALIKDGKPVKVVPEVFYGLSKLKIGKDFIISSVKTAGTEYKNFDPAKGITVDKAGKYDVTLAGVNGVNGSRTGIYTGEIETTLEASSTKQPITKVSLGKNKTLKIDANGKETPPDLIVKAGTTELKNGTECHVASLVVCGEKNAQLFVCADEGSNYTGGKSIKVKVETASEIKEVVGDLTLPYTGEPQQFDFITEGNPKAGELKVLNNEGKALKEGEDFYAGYYNNSRTGKATLLILGGGKYCTSYISKKFSIVSSEKLTVNVEDEDPDKDGIQVHYCKGETKGKVTVSYTGNDKTYVLGEKTDYTLKYENNKATGKASVTATGKGAFKGAQGKCDFTIVEQTSEDSVFVDAADVILSAGLNGEKAKKTKITVTAQNGAKLKAGTDYEVAGFFIDEAMTAKLEDATVLKEGDVIFTKIAMKNGYGFDTKGAFRVYDKTNAIKAAKVAFQDNKNEVYGDKGYWFTGNAITPGYGDFEGTVLVDGRSDQFKASRASSENGYFIDPASYQKNVAKGTGSFMLYGTGKVGGSKKVSFKIVQKQFTNDRTHWDDEGSEPTIKSVTITSTVTKVEKGKDITLTAEVKMTDGTDGGAVTWSSGSESVATIDGTTGVVTGVEAGTAVITATSAVDPNFSDSVVISVFSNEKKTTQFNFVGLSANQMGGAVSSLTTADTPATTDFASGTYTIAGATVYCKDKGNVRARAAKNSTTAVNFNSGASKDVGDVGTKVSLSDFPAYVSVPVTGEGTITVNYQPYRSSKGSESAKFAIIDGSGNVISRAVINAKNESGGAGEKAVLTADVSEKGDYYIVYSRNGASGGGVDIFDVTVEAVEGEGSKVYVQEITITADPGTTIDVDGTATLTAAVIPSAATDPSVCWTTGNNGILTVDDNGDNTATITGVSNGVTNVYALALDGSNVEGSIEITVGEAEKTFATAVSITGADTVQAGYTTVFTANITPETASDRSVTWSSANEDIATVNSQGVVAGIKEGTAAITAVANGSEPGKPEVKSTKNITVTKASTGSIPVSGITVNGAAVLGVGTSTKYTATVSPSNASNKTVTWSLEWVDPPETADIDAATGVVTGVSEGTAVVKATANDGSGVSGTFEITVKSASAVTSDAIKITEAKGWLESAYVEWSPSTDATIDGYNVYYKGLSDSGWTKLDDQLIRGYSNTAGGKTVDYWRADALGLSAGSYQMKVVGTVGGSESPAAPETGVLTVSAQDRAGYAFTGTETPGVYKADGTLKPNTDVVYVTGATAKTVTLDSYTGLQDILSEAAFKTRTRPLDIRIIGTIEKEDMDSLASSAQGLQIKNNKSKFPVTIEGVGEDGNIHGFGMLCRDTYFVEIRNLGVMICMDDSVSLDTNNHYTWVHNMDFFYGKGGSGDKAKGDGALDLKDDTMHQTYSYNHFWDCGKCSLCGMKSESGPNYITYHHNWFDHSDSRHPRIRKMTVHIYNNYFDGNSKYGVGATTGADAFVEANYFRNVKFPMMSSLQGNDVYAGTSTYNPGDYGTFSGESGGSIKSYNNKIVDTNNWTSYWPYSATGGVVTGSTITKGEINTLPTGVDTSVHFDAYEVADRNATVPTSVTSFSGGDTYSNFDTASDFYSYTADSPDDAKANVEAYAGRLNGGDFKWTFDNATEDTNYSVIPELKAALLNYKSCLVKSGGGSGGGDEPAAMTADLDMSSYLDSINTAASSAEGVATVAFSGTTVTATRVSNGTATLTIAGLKDSQNATYTVEATVTDTAITFGDPVKKEVAQYVTVGDKVTVTASASTIGKGKSLTLTANLEKEYGEELTFKWTYSYDSGLDGGGIDATGAEEGLEIITGQTGPTCTYTPDQIGDYYFFVEVTGNTSGVTIDSYNADPPAKVTVTESTATEYIYSYSPASNTDNYFTASGNPGEGGKHTIEGKEYDKGLKMESSNGTIVFKTSGKASLTVYYYTKKASGGIKLNDGSKDTKSSDYVTTTATSMNKWVYNIEKAGNYKLYKDTADTYIYYVSVTE